MKILKLLLLLILCGIPISLYSQSQKLKISLQGGFLNNGKNIYGFHREAAGVESDGSGWIAGGDFNYFFTQRFFVGAHFSSGHLYYFAKIMDPASDTYYREDEEKSSGSMTINNVGLVAGYCLPVSSTVNITGQIGFAQFIQIDSYPVMHYIPNEKYVNGFEEQIWYNGDDAFFSASFPVKFSVGYTPFKHLNIGLAKNIEIGYACGFYIEPDFGFFTAIYHGPQLSMTF
jgi:hypothetical protein